MKNGKSVERQDPMACPQAHHGQRRSGFYEEFSGVFRRSTGCVSRSNPQALPHCFPWWFLGNVPNILSCEGRIFLCKDPSTRSGLVALKPAKIVRRGEGLEERVKVD